MKLHWGTPITAIIRDEIVHGFARRTRFYTSWWVFSLKQGPNAARRPPAARLILNAESYGAVWSRGHHDGADLLAASALIRSAPR